MSFLIGQTVGDYAILEELGGGGFGRVYKVEHTLTRRREAMKVLAVGEANSTDQSERFLRVIRLQASLNHPNIATVLNAFWTDDHVVLISELLEGEPLKNLLGRGRLPFTQALDIMSQVLAALSYAQARGVIHRDVSPGNIFVTANSGPAKLIDFGLAKAAADLHVTQGGPVGSVHYMSPEQVQGLQTLDSRTDIYSCGAILYELATGQKLFDGESGFEIMQAHVEQPPRAPKSVDPAIPPTPSARQFSRLGESSTSRLLAAARFRRARNRRGCSSGLPECRSQLPFSLEPLAGCRAARRNPRRRRSKLFLLRPSFRSSSPQNPPCLYLPMSLPVLRNPRVPSLIRRRTRRPRVLALAPRRRRRIR
jgi:serine/threonine-protein kinase